MADVFSKAKRSEVMSRIRSRGNKDTEVVLAALFRAHGIIGWRRQLLVRVAVDSPQLRADRRKGEKLIVRKLMVDSGGRRGRDHQLSTKNYQLAVRPDFVFPKSRTAVFVDGCFWHGCPRHGTQPKGNAAFWKQKLTGNQARDRRVNRALRQAGWRVVRIWEHDLHRATGRRAIMKQGAKSHELRLLNRLRRALGLKTGKSSHFRRFFA